MDDGKVVSDGFSDHNSKEEEDEIGVRKNKDESKNGDEEEEVVSKNDELLNKNGEEKEASNSDNCNNKEDEDVETEEGSSDDDNNGNGKNGYEAEDETEMNDVDESRRVCAAPECTNPPVPLYCINHILMDPKQLLYVPCAQPINRTETGDIIRCGKPTIRCDSPRCSRHRLIKRQGNLAKKPKKKKNTTTTDAGHSPQS